MKSLSVLIYAVTIAGCLAQTINPASSGSGGGAPSGPAGGALTGTYPNPTLGGLGTANTVLMDGGSGNAVDATSAATIPALTFTGTTATDSASLGPELTSAGTCSGTGWTGTFPNYVAPGTTAPLTCTGFTSGSLYQTVTSIGAGGSGSVTIAIGTAQTASGASGTITAGLKANGTSLTFTPAATYTGTIGISAKLITPISQFTLTGKDSTSAASVQMLLQGTAALHNVYIGGGGASNTTGNSNTASGYQALNSNTTGVNNTGSGFQALSSNTTGVNNTANGSQALSSNTTGFNNTGSGFQALSSNTTGVNNTANGLQALNSNTTGGSNTANGYQALSSNTTGTNNTANGLQALNFNNTGGSNTANGYQAGYTATAANANLSGSNNTYIGNQCGPNTPTQLSNSFCLGSGALFGASNTGVLGNASVTDIYFGSTAAVSIIHAGGLGVGPSNTTLGTLTASILDRTATTGATLDLTGWDNNGHVSATTTRKVVVEGASQGATEVFSVLASDHATKRIDLTNNIFSVTSTLNVVGSSFTFNGHNCTIVSTVVTCP